MHAEPCSNCEKYTIIFDLVQLPDGRSICKRCKDKLKPEKYTGDGYQCDGAHVTVGTPRPLSKDFVPSGFNSLDEYNAHVLKITNNGKPVNGAYSIGAAVAGGQKFVHVGKTAIPVDEINDSPDMQSSYDFASKSVRRNIYAERLQKQFGVKHPEDGSEERYDDALARAPWLKHQFYWIIHNVIAHPLIGIFPHQIFFELHDWTSRKMHSLKK